MATAKNLLSRRLNIVQRNLNFLDLPIPEAQVWETLENEQRVVAIEVLARLIAQATDPSPKQERDLVVCGHCGRRLHIAYQGTNATPRYYCDGSQLNAGRALQCLNVGGVGIDQAVSHAFLEALTPAALEATTLAVQQLESNHDAALSQWRLEVERARYEAERAERQYKAVDPENRLVARGLEKEWETRLQNLAKAEAELFRREQQRPRVLTEEEHKRIKTLGSDLRLVWTAPTTTDRDRKELLRTLLEEVILKVERKESRADLTLRWRGGMTTKLDLPLKRYQAQGPTTDEDTMSLLRRLAVWQRVKRGELEALHVRQGQRKGLRIKVVDPPTGLFDQP